MGEPLFGLSDYHQTRCYTASHGISPVRKGCQLSREESIKPGEINPPISPFTKGGLRGISSTVYPPAMII
jgi:hypothetical protein